MVEKAEIKPESLLNFDDLLQCPVCYEIPTGQIFQCNEGHHVCGRCKTRLDVCPVCRALFFGTRNYAMEELIANFRKLRSLKSVSKVTSGSSESSTPAIDRTSEEPENDNAEDEENDTNTSNRQAERAPQACKGLFRCLCCKNGNSERLPAARLLNHLRYFHGPDLLQGRSENGEYLQAWQFSTVPGRLVTALRIADMGLFFLIIEMGDDSVCAWLAMAAAPWVANAFTYTVTICGNDREAIFTDCVWSVRSCEGTLKKRGHCLHVKELDARALVAPATISGKLSVRRIPVDQLTNQTQPRAVLRIANRVNNHNTVRDLEPFMQDLQNGVERLSRAFVSLGIEADALVRADADIRARLEHAPSNQPPRHEESHSDSENANADQHLSRNARRRMRQRLRAALNGPVEPPAPAAVNQRPNGLVHNGSVPSASSTSGGSSSRQQNGETRNKKKRRHRR